MLKIKYLLTIIFLLFIVTSCTMPNNNQNNQQKEDITVTVIYGYDIEDVIYNLKKGDKLNTIENLEYEFGTITHFTKSDGSTFDFNEQIKEDLTIYAKWDLLEFTCTFYDDDKKTIIDKQILKYGEKITYPANPIDKIYTGYKKVFKNWSRNIDIITNNVNIYAEYYEVYDQIIVSIKNNNLELIDEIEINYGSFIYEPDLPELDKKEGYYYKFIGWCNEQTNTLFDFDSDIYENVSIYPLYKELKIGKLSLSESTISFIGDSISTFYSSTSDINSFYHGHNEYYYPVYSQTVKNVSDTWWYQTYTKLGSKLGINNSLSGSAAYGAGSSAGMSETRLKTLDNNGTPNIIIIYLGTNDNVNGHTKENLKTAYNKMITYITENFTQEINNEFIVPDIYIINNGYSAYSGYNYKEQTRNEYNNLFNELSKEYNNVKVFDLANKITKDNYHLYLGDSLHYNKEGMLVISEYLTKQIKQDYEN